MSVAAKRDVLRHMVATVAYRGGIAVSGAPDGFAALRVEAGARTPGELLAHIGDLLDGSVHLLKGELVHLVSSPLPWGEEVQRFFDAAKRLDSYLASEAPLACPVETLVQGPVGDALTHVGQIVLLRRVAGSPVRPASYFTAEIVPGLVGQNSFGSSIVVRDATAGEIELAYDIAREAMREYVEQTWGSWDEQEQFERHRANWDTSTHRFIEVNGEVSGLMSVDELPECIWLGKLYVRPRWRQQGVGARILQDIIGWAARCGKPVRLRVLRVNTRAQAFYLRHGFRVVAETPERLVMEHSAGARRKVTS